MSRTLLLAVGAFILSSCGPSQGEIDAAALLECEQQRLSDRLEQEGESPELRAELQSVQDRKVLAINASESPDAIYEALEEIDCP